MKINLRKPKRLAETMMLTLKSDNLAERGTDSQQRVVMPFFRVILSRHESNPDWQIVSNPRWDYFTKAQSSILENLANDYAEYKNCGCMNRMVRVQDLDNYELKITDDSWALDPRHNVKAHPTAAGGTGGRH